ncbi:hypothetical protein Tco_0234620, partial [Tanacetum coccineum]
ALLSVTSGLDSAFDLDNLLGGFMNYCRTCKLSLSSASKGAAFILFQDDRPYSCPIEFPMPYEVLARIAK